MVSYEFDTELRVLGALILFRKELDEKLSLMSEDDFSHKACKEIFSIIKSTTKDFIEPRLIICKSNNDELKNIMMAACSQTGSLHEFQSALSELLSLSQGRRIKEKVSAIAFDEFYPEISDLEKIIEDEKSSNLIQGYAEKAIQDIDEYINSLGKDKEKIKVGFSDIDKTLGGGFRIPSVSIIGAAPSSGKTTFALNIASKQLSSVVIFSLEMSTEMLIERFASNELSIDYYRIQNLKPTENEEAKIKELAETLKLQGVYMFDDIYDIEQQARVIAEIKPRMVIVDYIQKVKTKKKTENRRNEVDYISGEYKRIANFNNCHIMLLSQVTRTERQTPTMANLKESGALEADGDYVMLIHRPYVFNKNAHEPDESYLLIDKNKFGGTGAIEMYFDGKHQRFSLRTNEHAPVRGFDGFTEYNGDLPF